MKRMIAILFLLPILFAITVSGQPAPAAEQKPAENAPNASAETRKPTPEQKLTEASNEAAGREEEGDEHAQFKHSPSVQYLARKTGMSLEAAYWTSILFNFAIVAGVIAWFVKKKMPGVFSSRTSAIQKSLEEARRASEDASRRLHEIENRLARLDTEITGMQSNAELQAREEETSLRAAVEEERQKILRSAEQEISSTASNARRELQAYAAELAVRLAEKNIKVDAAADAEIIRDFVDQLGTDGNSRRSS